MPGTILYVDKEIYSFQLWNAGHPARCWAQNKGSVIATIRLLLPWGCLHGAYFQNSLCSTFPLSLASAYFPLPVVIALKRQLKPILFHSCPQPLNSGCSPSFTSIYWASTIFLVFPPTSLELFLRAIWDAVSWAAVLILPQIKLNLKLSCFAFFFFFKSTVLNSCLTSEWLTSELKVRKIHIT